MQNKGFVKVFAVLLTLVCLYYLSFTFVTRHYENKAKEYANGDLKAESQYLDSLATEVVYPIFGYTLNECRDKEIGLGLDLKGGMNVILEVDASAVLRSLGNEDDPQFIQALQEASAENQKGSSKDFLTLFVEKYQAINSNARLANVFSSKVADIESTDDNNKVKDVLERELKGVTDNSVNVLRTRIDGFGVVAPNIQKLQNRSDRILIELPGIKDPERVKKLLQGSANLEFWKTYSQSEAQQYITNLDIKSGELLILANKSVSDSTQTDSIKVQSVKDLGFNKNIQAYFAKPEQLQDPKKEYAVGGAAFALVHKNDTAAVNAIIARFKDAYPSDLKFKWGFKPTDKKETYFQLYTLRGDGTKKGPALDGDVIVSAKADQVADGGSAWGVSMQMNSTGAKRWANITDIEAKKKNDPNLGQPGAIAIVLDGSVYSAPSVQNKIEGGNSQITGNFTVQEAKDLENVLKSGKMKAGIRIIQEDIVGPSLGQEAINSGVISFIIALIVLMIYMCLAYGFIPGMIANGALILNLFFTMGILASFHAVMTLPGIAGLVLTLAMAVDANVLIYERTREEIRGGKSIRAAVMDGYKHAFSAIFDANLTSIITAAILIYFGTGPIRGFATTLIIGISASFFTAVFMTRLVYEWGFSKGKFTNLTFCTSITKNLLVDTKYNFLKASKKAIIISLAVIVAGIASIFTLGLNQGIDFTGGRNYVVRFDEPIKTAQMEQTLIPSFEGATVRVITIGSSNQVRITTNYKIDDKGEDVELEIREKLNSALKGYMKPGASIDEHIQSSQKVEASMAKDMQVDATFAVIAAIICMALYILIRFRDLAFSIGTFAAVAHDAAIVIFIYSFFHKIMPFSMEVDQTFIAAVLTVVGYSINDKVVIFDRVREFRKLYPKRDSFSIMNESLNTTITRTLNTTLSSMIVVLCIFILGGETIRSFTFALFIGIFLGSYSSLFIASPIAYKMLAKKDHKEDKK
ncbi:protein translocase subunit SecDF [Dysgonomonas sp. 216]|uniref:protein translocase subunit SecDF n=1 Tax=Dysgonomonas sp. 216 TaxID=2302934 RepID=UPI0013D3D745|nr:protein translocase subunit SecDF [Dysgonomonas sp. 216]NDW19530.1 protein translocase subunit SecDF [Dysgonomonas sp. 216]